MPEANSIKPSQETIDALKGAMTEIGAGRVLLPKDEGDHAHNRACDRALKILRNYTQGYGLFQ